MDGQDLYCSVLAWLHYSWKKEGEQRVIRDWCIWIVCVYREMITWAQHSSSGLRKTECSSIAWSPMSSTMTRHHDNNNWPCFMDAWAVQCVFHRVASMTPRTARALKLLRLARLYSGCFLKLNTTTLNLLRVAEPYITWGWAADEEANFITLPSLLANLLTWRHLVANRNTFWGMQQWLSKRQQFN